MGWLYGWSSKKEILDHVCRDEFYSDNYKLLESRVVGNCVWVLLEKASGGRLIALNVLSSDKGVWGYKGMAEDCGPNYYNCPMSLIKKADVPPNEWAAEWREKVAKYHEEAAAKRKMKAELKRGDVVEFGGVEYRLDAKLAPRKGWLVKRVKDDEVFRMPASYLSRSKLIAA